MRVNNGSLPLRKRSFNISVIKLPLQLCQAFLISWEHPLITMQFCAKFQTNLGHCRSGRVGWYVIMCLHSVVTQNKVKFLAFFFDLRPLLET
jgi:hypothetical protein